MGGKKKLEFYGGEYVSFLPIALFVVLIIVTTFVWGSTSDGASWVPAFLGLLVPFFLAKDKKLYADAIINGIANKNTAVPIVCWIFAGIFARILRESGFADGLAGIAAQVGVNTLLFTIVSFLATVLFSTATGTGFGTITMGMGVLYPAGVALGVNPALMAGTILSGAAFGDNMAPVSDTLICSATAMNLEVTKCVKARFKYAVSAAVLTIAAMVLFGLFLDTHGGGGVEVPMNNKALIMLIPMAVTIVLAIRLGNIVIAATVGTVVAAVIGVAAGLFDFIQIDAVNPQVPALITVSGEQLDRTVGGILYNGISGMVQVIILCLMIFGMINIMKEGEGDIRLLDSLSRVVKGPVSAEITVSFMIIVLSALIGLNAPAILLIGQSFAKPYAEKYHTDPYRMATLLSGHSVTFCYCAPWTATMMLTIGFAGAAGYPLSGIQIMPFMFYAYALTFVLLVTSIFRGKKKGEGYNGN